MKYRIVRLAKPHYEFSVVPPMADESRFYEYAVQCKWLCFWFIGSYCHSEQEGRDIIKTRHGPSPKNIIVYEE
jgi:hypothetical protein